jgi:hypothetical protein
MFSILNKRVIPACVLARNAVLHASGGSVALALTANRIPIKSLSACMVLRIALR